MTKGREREAIIAVRVSVPTWQELHKRARAMDLTMSYLLRKYIRAGLSVKETAPEGVPEWGGNRRRKVP